MTMTVMEAYEVACREVDAQGARSQATAGTFVDDRNQVRQIPHSVPFEHMPHDQRPAVEPVNTMPGLGGRPCLEHREKVHVFADGTEMKCCTHTFCGWGRSTKKHSDGTVSGTYSPDTLDTEEPEIEVTEDDPVELSPPTLTALVGEDIAEPDCEDIAVEQAGDEAAEDEEEWDDE
jgi:hypothetical protein